MLSLVLFLESCYSFNRFIKFKQAVGGVFNLWQKCRSATSSTPPNSHPCSHLVYKQTNSWKFYCLHHGVYSSHHTDEVVTTHPGGARSSEKKLCHCARDSHVVSTLGTTRSGRREKTGQRRCLHPVDRYTRGCACCSWVLCPYIPPCLQHILRSF